MIVILGERTSARAGRYLLHLLLVREASQARGHALEGEDKADGGLGQIVVFHLRVAIEFSGKKAHGLSQPQPGLSDLRGSSATSHRMRKATGDGVVVQESSGQRAVDGCAHALAAGVAECPTVVLLDVHPLGHHRGGRVEQVNRSVDQAEGASIDQSLHGGVVIATGDEADGAGARPCAPTE